MSTFSLSIDSLEHGWAQASVAADDRHFTMSVSYLSDALGDLAEAVLVLLKSPAIDKIVCSWQKEPGEYRWVLHREGKGVKIEILYFGQCFSRLSDEHGQQVFKTHCTPMRLATQVKGQLHQLLNEHGEEGYETRWRHRFPKLTFNLLEEIIQINKHSTSASEIGKRNE